MDIRVLWISVFRYPCFYGYKFGYPWIFMDIHALTCYGFSIQGNFVISKIRFFSSFFSKVKKALFSYLYK